MPFIVAHDVGTRQVKSVLVSAQGQLVAAASSSLHTERPAPGWAEQAPDSWWQAVQRGTRSVLRTAGVPPQHVNGLVFTGQMLGIVPVAADGRLLRSAILWSDARAGAEAAALMNRLLGRRVFSLAVGATASAKDVVPKLLWLQAHEPQTAAAVSTYLDVHGYLVWRCTGAPMMDWTAASATGLFDPGRKDWRAWLARLVDVPLDRLPRLRRPGEVAGLLRPGAAAELGLPAGVPVVCGAGDAPCAAMGAGAGGVGEGHIYLGTSGWVGIATRRPHRSHRGIATLQAAAPDVSLLVGETQAAGACREWLAAILGGAAIGRQGAAAGRQGAVIQAALDAAVERTPPGAEGVLFAPWLVGERAPVPNARLRAAFLGLGVDHGPDHLARAVCEGVALNLRWILDIISRRYGHDPSELRLVGGGAASDTWSQVLADVTGRNLARVVAAREATAMGAAYLALATLGATAPGAPNPPADDGPTPNVERRFQPRAEHRAVYDERYNAYRRAHRVLAEFHRSDRLDPGGAG